MNNSWQLLLFLLTIAVTGCATSDRPNFMTMSEEEIFAYNLEQPMKKKVYCFEEAQTSTFIRRRQCMTVEDYIYRLERSMLALDVLQPTGISNFGPPRD